MVVSGWDVLVLHDSVRVDVLMLRGGVRMGCNNATGGVRLGCTNATGWCQRLCGALSAPVIQFISDVSYPPPPFSHTRTAVEKHL